ncbi:MAG: gfo/Idh/MocA family oxidoreductase, partial [Pirellulaceae bacterium]
MRHVNRRVFIGTAISAGAATTLPVRSLFATNANEEISLGFISCGGRAGQLMKPFSRVPGVNIAGLCDPDEDRLASAKQRYPKARTWTH